mmetsp:Transcript_46019/g.116450  ORF Transcript_46019/g.116450 Transcript_46019/m.116450 type:complete len:325 (+) Transcript_46019:432-1406(+)
MNCSMRRMLQKPKRSRWGRPPGAAGRSARARLSTCCSTCARAASSHLACSSADPAWRDRHSRHRATRSTASASSSAPLPSAPARPPLAAQLCSTGSPCGSYSSPQKASSSAAHCRRLPCPSPAAAGCAPALLPAPGASGRAGGCGAPAARGSDRCGWGACRPPMVTMSTRSSQSSGSLPPLLRARPLPLPVGLPLLLRLPLQLPLSPGRPSSPRMSSTAAPSVAGSAPRGTSLVVSTAPPWGRWRLSHCVSCSRPTSTLPSWSCSASAPAASSASGLPGSHQSSALWLRSGARWSFDGAASFSGVTIIQRMRLSAAAASTTQAR